MKMSTHHLRDICYLILSITLSAFLAGCTLPSSMQKATSVASSDSLVIIVGKFELDPPIDSKLEQSTHWNVIGEDAILNKIIMATGNDPKPVDTDIVMSEWQNAIEAEQGKTYFLHTARKRTYLKGAMITLDVTNQDRIWLPGNVFFDVPKDAKAIYLGTLRYSRNDFNDIQKVELIDEYNLASTEFRNKFGDSTPLVRSLLQNSH